MCTKLNNGNMKHSPASTNRTEIDFSLVDKISSSNVSSLEIPKQFPCLMEFAHNENMVALTAGQMEVIQQHYKNERKAYNVNLGKFSEIPVIRVKPQDEYGKDEVGFVYIRFLKKNANTIWATIYSPLPSNGPIYIEEFHVYGLSKARPIYIDRCIKDNPDFLENIQEDLGPICISVLSFIESYPEFIFKSTEKHGKKRCHVTLIKPFKYIEGYTRKKCHVRGYFKHT